MNDLEKLREEINTLDKNIADLYQKRMILMKDVATIKKNLNMAVLDEDREKQVIEKNLHYISDPDLKPYYKDFIQFIMDQGKDMQKKLI